jgi:hypothetical protein
VLQTRITHLRVCSAFTGMPRCFCRYKEQGVCSSLAADCKEDCIADFGWCYKTKGNAHGLTRVLWFEAFF